MHLAAILMGLFIGLDVALVATATCLAFLYPSLTPVQSDTIARLWTGASVVASFLVGLLAGHLAKRA
jgi:6-phosphogluconate dehydrogenase (decarboxylating)